MRLDGEAWEQPLPLQDEQPLDVSCRAVTCIGVHVSGCNLFRRPSMWAIMQSPALASMCQHTVLPDVQPDSHADFGSPSSLPGPLQCACA